MLGMADVHHGRQQLQQRICGGTLKADRAAYDQRSRAAAARPQLVGSVADQRRFDIRERQWSPLGQVGHGVLCSMGKEKHIALFEQERRQSPGLYPAMTLERRMKAHPLPERHGDAPWRRQLAAAIARMG